MKTAVCNAANLTLSFLFGAALALLCFIVFTVAVVLAGSGSPMAVLIHTGGNNLVLILMVAFIHAKYRKAAIALLFAAGYIFMAWPLADRAIESARKREHRSSIELIGSSTSC